VSSIFSFPAGADSDLPPQRRALARNSAERAGLIAEDTRLEAMLEKLAAKLGVVDDAERERDDLLNRDAQSLLDKLRDGRDAVLSSFGLRARALDEKIAATRHQAAIVEKTIVAIGVERELIAERIAELDELAEFLVKDSILEATASELVDYTTACEHLRGSMVFLMAVSRVLRPASHDYMPGADRIAVVAPDFAAADGSELAIVAEPRAIARAEAILRQFAAELLSDPRTPLPELEVDALDDPSTPYHELSGPERRAVDQAFAPPVNQHRETVDAQLFAEQIEAAKAANS
jgi:hypothetical protein